MNRQYQRNWKMITNLVIALMILLLFLFVVPKAHGDEDETNVRLLNASDVTVNIDNEKDRKTACCLRNADALRSISFRAESHSPSGDEGTL